MVARLAEIQIEVFNLFLSVFKGTLTSSAMASDKIDIPSVPIFLRCNDLFFFASTLPVLLRSLITEATVLTLISSSLAIFKDPFPF
jgi:hypothetical protein